VTAVQTTTSQAGARRGARRVSRHRLVGPLVAVALLLAGCETGPEMVQNNVAQCIAHIKIPAQYGEPFCRCLGAELERNFNYAQIREYRLKTDNWTYFADVAGDPGLMRVNRLCLARHVPEEFR
jgi:hypothetical protein